MAELGDVNWVDFHKEGYQWGAGSELGSTGRLSMGWAAAGLTGEEWNMAGKGRCSWTGEGGWMPGWGFSFCQEVLENHRRWALWILTSGSAVLIGWNSLLV